MRVENDGLEGRTAVIAGAGCAIGAALAEGLARAGARVVVVDHDEAAALDIARRRAEAVDALALDVMDPALCARLGAAWEDEPLHLLVQLQPVRHPDCPTRALASVEALTVALAGGLRAGRGGVVIVDARPPGRSVARSVLAGAAARLPAALQGGFAAGAVAVNGVRLGTATPARPEIGALCALVLALARPGGARFGGALLPLLPPFPEAAD